MRKLNLLALFAAVMMAFTACIEDDITRFPTREVSGTVTDSADDYLQDVKVKVRTGHNTQTGDHIASSTTNSTGDYTLSLTDGTYTLEFARLGYITQFSDITVDETNLDNVNATLPLSDAYYTVSGYVTNDIADELEGVMVKVREGHDTTDGDYVQVNGQDVSATTGEQGEFSISLLSWEYTLELTLEGYEPSYYNITVEDGDITDADPVMVPEVPFVAGYVLDLSSGNAIEDVEVKVREGHESHTGPYFEIDGTAVSATCAADGRYVMSLPAGEYALEFTKTDYITEFLDITVDGGSLVTDNAFMTAELGVNEYRVAVQWYSEHDLDAHLTGVLPDQNDFHVGYDGEDEIEYPQGTTVAERNNDAAGNSKGNAESITFTFPAESTFIYWVCDHDGGDYGNLDTTNAVVKVYKGSELLYTYNTADYPDAANSTRWKVFQITDMEVYTEINTFDTGETPPAGI